MAALAAGASSSSSAPAATSQFTMPSRCCCSQLSGRRRRRRSSHSSMSTLRTLLLALTVGGIPLLHTLLPAAVLAQPQPQAPPPLRLQFSNNFSSPASSSPDSSTTPALLCLGACELTPTHATLPTAPSPGAIGIGRLLYRTPVRFTSPASRTCASFRTSFIFSIASVAAATVTGSGDDSGANSGAAAASAAAPIADGLAFVITPRAGIPPRSGGGALGLFEPMPSDAGSGRPVPGTPPGTLAVEIDTFAGASNAWDPGYAPHVGLDLDSLRSVAVSPPVPEVAAGSTVGVWVRYDAGAAGAGGGSDGRLTVRVHATQGGGASVPEEARARTVVEYAGLDLAAAVPGESFVGFSATQGMYAQTNTLWFWDFELSFSQDEEGGGQGEEEGPLAAAAGAGDNGQIVTAGAGNDTRRRRSVALAVAAPLAALGLCLMLVWTRRRWRKSGSGSSSISSSRPLVPLSSVPALEMADRPQRSPSPASGDGDHGCGCGGIKYLLLGLLVGHVLMKKQVPSR